MDKNYIEENLEIIAENLQNLQKVGEAFSSSRINEKTIVWLISKASGVPQGQCKKILNSMAELEKTFLKKKGPKHDKQTKTKISH